ncbi:protein ORF67 [Cyprinid herpesvirus 3]|uniref:Protein ORF67 n=1 Tax=Cyprinid herpesvirus 3 TaxID=180230 RepID=A3QMN5_CYHV3|nr:unnamed protein product [Cyprinid herpesvirus 3]ABC55177.1 hypothetical protein [Cyprinid herpesvirus 3]ABG42894.1 protein ORF67 [Cyprinid herpesvirus 3]AJP55555.1 protein ORF67 [Cyprinid herpesvirus 3]AJP55710.1 protein ORF67 [Cyprinid herpesvirus 3]AOO32472.1 protein ORF67 [Cyprinid herpesvirus 3]
MWHLGRANVVTRDNSKRADAAASSVRASDPSRSITSYSSITNATDGDGDDDEEREQKRIKRVKKWNHCVEPVVVERDGLCQVSTWCMGAHSKWFPAYPCLPSDLCRPVLQLCDSEGTVHTYKALEPHAAGRYHSEWPCWTHQCMADPYELKAHPVHPAVGIRLGTVGGNGRPIVAGRCALTPAVDPFFGDMLWDYGVPLDYSEEDCDAVDQGRDHEAAGDGELPEGPGRHSRPLGPGCFKLLFCYPSRNISYLCRDPIISEAFDCLSFHCNLTVERPDDGVPAATYERRSVLGGVRP